MGNKKSLSPEELERKREQDRIRKQQKRLNETENERNAKRQANAERQRRWRANRTDEQRSHQRSQRVLKKRNMETEERQSFLEAERVRQAKRRNDETEEGYQVRLEAERVRQAQRRNDETEEGYQVRLEVERIRQTQRRNDETEEGYQARLEAERVRQAQRRNDETEEGYQARLEAERVRQAQRRNDETEEGYQARLEAECVRQAQRRNDETEEGYQARLEAERVRQAQRRNDETEEGYQARLEAECVRQAQRRNNETEEERQARQDTNRRGEKRRRENETLEQTQRRISSVRSSQIAAQELTSQRIRDEAINFDENTVQLHSCGELNVKCQFCGAYHFLLERPKDGKFNSCCHKGKMKLDTKEYPTFLKNLMTIRDRDGNNFMSNIRKYNNGLSFTSMGAKTVDVSGRGPYVFKVQGQAYHRTSHVEPVNGNRPKYAQLYVVDSEKATEERMAMRENEKCFPHLMQLLDEEIRKINEYAKLYHNMREVMQEERQLAEREGKEIPQVSMVFRKDRRSDQRRYNAPSASEIAMIFVNEDGEPPFERDIRVYPKNPRNENQQFINMHVTSPNLDPMTYVLLFPYGEPGWQPRVVWDKYNEENFAKRSFASMLQYKSAHTAIRDNFNPILHAKKLTQQWIVDSYLQIEANNLYFIRTQQSKLRTELYQGLADHIANNVVGPAGHQLILPSSFEGSPRNMRERCVDAMAIFAKFGPPDLFITFTANPNWPEITKNLPEGYEACDRPDLVARVFRLKLRELLDDLTKHGVLGKVKAFVYTIEFQKRGLPHAHILLTLQKEDKLKTAEAVDKVICAEIPDQQNNPKLFKAVTRYMIHGPCGSQCMENNQCKKHFPKDFNEATVITDKGYPHYRRRANIEVNVRGCTIDNRFVIPYNPFLLAKYDAHINVESCTSLKAVKYIYKYIYKGFDCANLEVYSGTNQERSKDEITNFVNGRYVSPIEAMWRILEFPMHDRSHAVMRLPIHLPDHQYVVFTAGQEAAALDNANQRGTRLTKFFELNQSDEEARNLLYTDIPYHYVWKDGKWEKRKRGGDKVIPRMYSVSLTDRERFYLRMLLLHVKGATSFEDLRTFNGEVYATFQEAASARGILESDLEWKRCLEEAVSFQMPKSMRQMFVFILLFNTPENSLALWEEFRDDMSLDHLRSNTPDNSYNMALAEINDMLMNHGKKCADFNLPMPTVLMRTNEIVYDIEFERNEAERLIEMLNDDQRSAFNRIKSAMESVNAEEPCFFLDGPGGSGKTHLYRTLMSYCRGKGDTVLPFATTGIAATLLKGGRTVHSGFKLPVPINETSVSFLKHTSPQAENFRKASLIIIDEVTMLQKDGLRCIDKVLKELTGTDKPFGGKVIVIGGDFRQTLPVVPHGSRVDIIETCIKSSPLWQHFTKLSLRINMRSEGQTEFNNWLLDIGCGRTERIPVLSENMVEIPDDVVTSQPIVETIFGNSLHEMSTEELTKRVILASTNEVCLNINKDVIKRLPGDERIYYSADSLVSDDPNDALNYPVEFLNSITISGMPPHQLALKTGAIVMLIRNLCPAKGLCNGTRLIIRSLQQHSITAEILSECNKGDIVNIPRIDLAPSDVSLPFILRRRQFPVIPAFAVTINKSQGQTYDYVGIFLNDPVFSHGQLYVALSRSKNRNNIKMSLTPGPQQGKLMKNNKNFTHNIVYKEIFDM